MYGIWVCFVLSQSCCVSKSDLQVEILPQPPEFWDCGHTHGCCWVLHFHVSNMCGVYACRDPSAITVTRNQGNQFSPSTMWVGESDAGYHTQQAPLSLPVSLAMSLSLRTRPGLSTLLVLTWPAAFLVLAAAVSPSRRLQIWTS